MSYGDDSDNIEEIPGTGIGEDDLEGKVRRFAALSQMEDPEEPPANSRVDDERHGASGGPGGPDATAASINPSSVSAGGTTPASTGDFNHSTGRAGNAPDAPAPYEDDPQEKAHLADLVAQRQALLNPAPKPSLKHRILAGIMKIAPTAIAAGVGGAPAASGAAAGTMGVINQQREDAIRQQSTRNQQAATLGQQVQQVQGRMDTQRFEAGQNQKRFTNAQTLADKVAERGQAIQDQKDAEAQQRLDQTQQNQNDRDDARFKETEANTDRRFSQQDKITQERIGASEKAQDKRLAAQVAMYNTKKEDNEGKVTPATQKVLMETEPVKQQIDEILDRLEPNKDNNTPGTSFGARLKYKMGMGSPEDKAAGDLDDMMGKISMSGIVGAARILKGSSRAYQVFAKAQDHLPNPWTDSYKKMYEQLTSVRQNIQDIEDDAVKFGSKSGKVPPVSGPRSSRASGAASAGSGSPAGGDFGPAPQGFPEGHTGTTKSGQKVMIKGGRWVPQKIQ